MEPRTSARVFFRRGFTLTEVLVVIGLIMILLSLLMPAVGSARAAARRLVCAKTAREIAAGTTLYHDSHKVLPPGTDLANSKRPFQGWYVKVLPYLEQVDSYAEAETAYQLSANPFDRNVHVSLSRAMPIFACPDDPRTSEPRFAYRHGYYVGLTGYIGNAGQDYREKDGVLFGGSQIRFADIHDGLSHTILIGERPPSPLHDYGWWYAGMGVGDGGLDHTLGSAETADSHYARCTRKWRRFRSGERRNECDVLHFWSMHRNGAHFARCDGSVKFLDYSAGDLLIALSTRDKGDVAPDE